MTQDIISFCCRFEIDIGRCSIDPRHTQRYWHWLHWWRMRIHMPLEPNQTSNNMSHTFHTYTLIRLTFSWEAQDSNGIFWFFLYRHTVIYIQTFDTRSYSNMKTAISWKKCVLECIFWNVHVLYTTNSPHRNSSGRMFIQTKWSILHDFFFKFSSWAIWDGVMWTRYIFNL